MVKAHLPGRRLSGFSPVVTFLLLQLFPLSSFSWLPDKFYDLVGYLVHFEKVYYPALRDHIVCLFVDDLRNDNIFSSHFVLFEDVLINVQYITCSFVHPFCSSVYQVINLFPNQYCEDFPYNR